MAPFWTHQHGSAPKPPASVLERALGSYLGLAVGDALGATVEFMTAGEIFAQYKVHRNLSGGGWLRLKPGQVTDDTGMALALGGAIVSSAGWSLARIADSFVQWMRSRPVDIGSTCRRGIRRYLSDGSLSAQPAQEDGGNGAAMRNLPTVLASLHDEEVLIQRSIEQAHITHYQAQSDAGCVVLARITRLLLLGGGMGECLRLAEELVEEHRQFRFNPWPGNTSGYIVDTVQTVFDAFFSTRSFEESLLRAVNRGGDADTAGALAGQLAGALYGVDAIPARWLRQLDPAINTAVRTQTSQLLALTRKAFAVPDGMT